MELYARIMEENLLVRRVYVTANHVVSEESAVTEKPFEQMDLFTDYEAKQKNEEDERIAKQKEKSIQRAMLDIKKKYGKNAILKGTNFEEGAMTKERSYNFV